MKELIRKWYFTINDHDGHSECIDTDGNITDETDEKKKPFEGTNHEAAKEADRRADLFEGEHDCCVARVTYHSLGIMRIKKTDSVK